MFKSSITIILSVAFFLILRSGFLHAQPPSGYYDAAIGLTGNDLHTALYNIIKDHNSVSYTPGVWNAFYTTDVRNSNKIWDFIPKLIGTYEVRVKKNSYRKARQSIEVRENQERELIFNLQSLEDSLAQQAKIYRDAKIIYGTGALLSACAGAYFMYSADQLAKKYPTATSDASEVYDQMEHLRTFSYVALGASVPLGIMYIVKASQQKRTSRKIDVALFPARDGALFYITYNF
jgi:predicted HAD superfamily hydrolase